MRVWVLGEQTRTRKSDGYEVYPIKKPAGIEFRLCPHPNGAKTHRVSGFGYPLPSLALTAEQPDPCGPEPYSPGKRPRTRSPLGKGLVAPRIPGVALSQNSWGPRTSRGVPDLPGVPDPCQVPDPDPHTLSRLLSGVELTPRLGLVRNRHVSHARTQVRARARGREAFTGRVAYLPHSMQ